MKIQLSDHFTYRRLLRFVFPSIVMMVFTSIYGVVDGLFVSNFVGKDAFAAINLIMPFLMIFGGVGFMFGTGGSALVAMTLGEKKKERANEYFTMIVAGTAIVGVIISLIACFIMRPVAIWLGAEGEIITDCVIYGRIMMIFNIAFMLQNAFQGFFITAEKPHLGLVTTVAAGLTNMVLDALLVGVLKWGVAGAAIATGLCQVVGGIIPLIYFIRPNNSLLKMVRTKLEIKSIARACWNGASEFVSNTASSIVGIVYNFQLLKYAGSDGVAANGVLMYVQFIFIAMFIGYAMGGAPIISYHYGADNTDELRNMFKKSNIIMGIAGVIMAVLAFTLAGTLSKIFVGYDPELFAMTKHAFRIFSLAFIFSGFTIFASSFFTALNNGGVSAAISFLRTFIFKMAAVLIMPLIWELDGIWWSVTIAEVFALIISVIFLVVYRKKYNYI